MARAKARKLHIALDPPVEALISGRRVRFVGLNLLGPHVMVEYEVDPPLARASLFGPHLVLLHVTDDTSNDPYPTAWEDFPWPSHGPGRTTTRLDRRPSPNATRLHVVVLPLDGPTPAVPGPATYGLRAVAEFDVQLPSGHGLPWGQNAPTPAGTATSSRRRPGTGRAP